MNSSFGVIYECGEYRAFGSMRLLQVGGRLLF
jgi:hypothetical protein